MAWFDGIKEAAKTVLRSSPLGPIVALDDAHDMLKNAGVTGAAKLNEVTGFSAAAKESLTTSNTQEGNPVSVLSSELAKLNDINQRYESGTSADRRGLTSQRLQQQKKVVEAVDKAEGLLTPEQIQSVVTALGGQDAVDEHEEWKAALKAAETSQTYANSEAIEPADPNVHADSIERAVAASTQNKPAQTVANTNQTVPPPKNFPEIGFGNTGEAVIAVQKFLGIEEDGNFGYGTEAAVIAYQKENGLNPDGIVGKNTWELISKSLAEKAASEVVQNNQTTTNNLLYTPENTETPAPPTTPAVDTGNKQKVTTVLQ